MERNLSSYEFYQKYFVAVSEGNKSSAPLREVDKDFFDMMDKAIKEGKQLLRNRTRGRDWGSYMFSLAQTARELTKGNSVCVLSQKPQSFIDDLQKFFGIEVNQKASTKNNSPQSSVVITLKNQAI